MGTTFKSAEKYLPEVSIDDVFVEIGSDRYEGSTEYFADLAVRNNTILHTVDLSNEPQSRITRDREIPGIVWHQAEGVEWCRNTWPTLQKKIVCLYLDNFDYDWEVTKPSPNIIKQKQQYQELFDIEMNNMNCQLTHLQQMMALLPYMSQKSLIICDDTYLSNDCWIGKCGAVVVYLVAHGYQIVDTEKVGGYSYGVILARN
jgi:hypothetical protein